MRRLALEQRKHFAAPRRPVVVPKRLAGLPRATPPMTTPNSASPATIVAQSRASGLSLEQWWALAGKRAQRPARDVQALRTGRQQPEQQG